MKALEYQNKIATALSGIFGEDLVKTEWDSVKNDGHIGNHKSIYAPRHDIAVGPFNTYGDIDLGNDYTKIMQRHPFTKRLKKRVLKYRESLKKIWNPASRCYLAIEIEFNGTSKHMMGSIINASVTGSIGLVITSKDKIHKAERLCNYLMRLEGLERININALKNLIIFDECQFLEFLSEFKR